MKRSAGTIRSAAALALMALVGQLTLPALHQWHQGHGEASITVAAIRAAQESHHDHHHVASCAVCHLTLQLRAGYAPTSGAIALVPPTSVLAARPADTPIHVLLPLVIRAARAPPSEV